MKRRTFIKLSILSISGLLVSAYLVRFKQVVNGMIKKDTANQLKDSNDIDLFISDAEKEGYWNSFSPTKQLFIAAQFYAHTVGLNLPMRKKYLQLRNKITGQFLISTDLFVGVSNWKEKKITYIKFYNPYKRACSNPFSSMYFN